MGGWWRGRGSRRRTHGEVQRELLGGIDEERHLGGADGAHGQARRRAVWHVQRRAARVALAEQVPLRLAERPRRVADESHGRAAVARVGLRPARDRQTGGRLQLTQRALVGAAQRVDRANRVVARRRKESTARRLLLAPVELVRLRLEVLVNLVERLVDGRRKVAVRLERVALGGRAPTGLVALEGAELGARRARLG